MHYEFSLLIPAATAEEAPVTETLEISKGIIHHIEVEFYAGVRRFAWSRLFYHNHQVYPTNIEGSFRTDAYTIAFDDYLEINSEPYELVLKGYSPDADYEHTVVVRVDMLQSQIAITLLQALKAILKMAKLLGIKV